MAFAGALQEGLAVKVGGSDVSAGLAHKVAPNAGDGASVGTGDLEGAARVGVLRGFARGIIPLVGVERGKVVRGDPVERAPDLVSGRREDIGHAALPFIIGQGESEAVVGEAGRMPEAATGTEPVHLCGAQVGAVGEVEQGCQGKEEGKAGSFPCPVSSGAEEAVLMMAAKSSSPRPASQACS